MKKYHPWARYRRASGFTQAQIATYLGVSRRYVICLEQSLFRSPPNNITIKLAGKYGIALDVFEESYYQFVRETREAFAVGYKLFSDVFQQADMYDDKGYRGTKHPLVFYREYYGLSRMGLCKGLCLHYDPIYEFENNKQRAIPDQLKEACKEIKWDWHDLSMAVADWRRRGNADRLLRA